MQESQRVDMYVSRGGGASGDDIALDWVASFGFQVSSAWAQ